MDTWITILITSIVLNLYLGYKFWIRPKKLFVQKDPQHTPQSVGKFYNTHNKDFVKVYGEVIQAFRTTDVTKLLDYQIEQIDFERGKRYLDAGCGVCGPARYFAQKTGAKIEAITISEVQAKEAKELIQKDGLEDLVSVRCGDYQQLHEYYDADSFDGIYFLESFGHASDHAKAVHGAWGMLKPGGILYIKDLFKKISPLASLEKEMEQEIENINTAYHYNVAELNEILDIIRKKGFILSSLKTIDIKLDEFENLTISNDFQELTGINKIENLQEYVFPVDFFEIKCIKPWYDLDAGNSRYFLQNLFYLQVHNRKTDSL